MTRTLILVVGVSFLVFMFMAHMGILSVEVVIILGLIVLDITLLLHQQQYSSYVHAEK